MKDSNVWMTCWYLVLEPFRHEVVYRLEMQMVTADFFTHQWGGESAVCQMAARPESCGGGYGIGTVWSMSLSSIGNSLMSCNSNVKGGFGLANINVNYAQVTLVSLSNIKMSLLSVL